MLLMILLDELFKKVREIKPGKKADYESESVNEALNLLEKRGVIEKIETREKDRKVKSVSKSKTSFKPTRRDEPEGSSKSISESISNMSKKVIVDIKHSDKKEI